MKAIILKDFGGVENLELTEKQIPSPGANEVLIKLSAISINPVDVKTRSGKGIAGLIKDQLPVILGWDISGTITEIGEGVTRFKTGDEVFAMLAFPGLGNTYAGYVVAKADELAIKPENVNHNDAAAASLAALTAWQALTSHANVQAGQRVLIHAAAGGVGHYAVQMAKHLGAYVIGTASAANRDFVLQLGADEHVDYRVQPFEEVIKDIDFVLDSMGGDYIDRSLKVTKKGGTIISIPSGLNETVTEKAKALGINGYTIRVKPNGNDMGQIAGLLADGTVRSHVSAVFPFEEMAVAHQQIETGRTVGKVVLTF
ncbi:NADP-dependent oxidoreductase [Pedobacter sp. HDW13]|uniref:NADP-dependent oxidoreductase n=1 Tax=unclassified Pedobacter TaxID=2628915 RepID=UPI000F591855|nr:MULTISPECIES: NADP-dependent oxidoreductase [unclassified Pedobacter]QIL41565.1 NADP-dependent oxidoreductase [Pedobacter sp. HDW13]RQO77859.1 oxidoreductase [Pedobacter sp. KBW01]